jgi:aminoglycoside phosphotransferase (APT) family kinase protein
MSEAGTPLPGGRVTPGVVRVGDTVRRPRRANSDFVRRLLQHLRAVGFDAAPAPLGGDAEGREIFSYIDGEVPRELGVHADSALASAARLIRRYHDATVALAQDAEVICHNDLSPCNFVFRDAVPVAIIDFDTAAPGARVADVGYAAWLWLNIGLDDIAAAEQHRRLRLFIEAYGSPDAAPVLSAMLERQSALAVAGQAAGDAAMAEWAAECRVWTMENLETLRG